jgi:RNA polymerase sigma-70 factor (family 1)
MTKEYLNPYQRCDTSFDQLFKKYNQFLIHYATQIVRDRIVAEDIVSEAFYKFFINQKNEKCELSKKGFLFACTKNECIDFLRTKRFKERQLKILIRHVDEYEDVTLNVITRKELVAKVRNVIETLPPVCKRVIVLSYMHDLNRNEIAQELKISPNTVKKHKAVGLKWLKAKLNDCSEFRNPWAIYTNKMASQN